jgi:hypothetical protein
MSLHQQLTRMPMPLIASTLSIKGIFKMLIRIFMTEVRVISSGQLKNLMQMSINRHWLSLIKR